MTYSIEAEARRAVRARMFGSTQCARCGESNPIALVWRKSLRSVLCATCDACVAGRSTLEAHHPLGMANGEWTIPVSASLHRHFTHLQRDWPRTTLTNSEGARLLRIASGARFVHDTLTIATSALTGTRGLERVARCLALCATSALVTARTIEENHTTRIGLRNKKEETIS